MKRSKKAVLRFAQQLCQFISFSTQKELCAYPCLGLVSHVNSGCHVDMDASTMQISLRVLEPYWKAIKELVVSQTTFDFKALKQLGWKYEKIMLKATGQINTYKGLIFHLGIVMYACLYCYKNSLAWTEISSLIAKMVKPILQQELQTITSDATSLARTILQLEVIETARHHALNGYLLIFQGGLNFFQKLLLHKITNWNQLYGALVVYYLAYLDDTTLINKIGIMEMKKVKIQAHKWLDLITNNYFEQFWSEFENRNADFIAQKISPGGCADFAIVTVFLALCAAIYDPATADATFIWLKTWAI